MALSGCEVARSGPGGGRVGGGEAIPGRSRSHPRPLVLCLNRRLADSRNRLHKVSRVNHPLRVFSCAREERSSGGGRGRGRAPAQLRGRCSSTARSRERGSHPVGVLALEFCWLLAAGERDRNLALKVTL